jgi:hypothetical protein
LLNLTQYKKGGTMATRPRAPTRQKGLANRLVLGFAGATAAAVIGTAGIAAAESPGKTVTIPSKAACDNFQQFGFKNRGQCVSAYEQALHNKGSGYGGGVNNTANTAVTVNVNGNNNNIDVAISNIF